MTDELFEFYGNTFNIEKNRIKELISEFAIETLNRAFKNELDNPEYTIEVIYQVGKTEDERLFLSFYVGEIRQTMYAIQLLSNETKKLVDIIKDAPEPINKDTYISLITLLVKYIITMLQENVGEPDYDNILKKDKDFFNKIKDILEIFKKGEKHDNQI